MPTNAHALLDALAQQGVEHVFTNAGTDTAPIIEAIAQRSTDAPPVPAFHIVPHENVAMAMAHGYYRFGHKLAAVLLHTTVGSANAVMGTMNARRDRVPILMLAGRTPHTHDGQTGSRTLHIHWGQDTFDQGGILREWTKWDYELRAGQSVQTVVSRAASIARSQPAGPVYLTLPREVLAAEATAGHHALTPDNAVIPPANIAQQVADHIARAELPLIVTSSGGREPEAFELLSRLAEDRAIPVAQPFASDANLPTDHSMNFGMEGMELVSEADLLLVIEAGVPWTTQPLRKDALVVQVAADAQYADYPLRNHQSDLAITATPSAFLRYLGQALDNTSRHNVPRRRRLLIELNEKRRERQHAAVERAARQTPIRTEWLAHCINAAKDDTTMIINELGVPADYLNISEPRTYLRESTAGGLGLGLGAALGAKLAMPGRQALAVMGDGAYMFGNPTPAHFVSRALRLGALTVINNNQRWQAVHNATTAMYPDGHAARAAQMPLTALTPSPDFEKIVSASGGFGERVEQPGELLGAIERGLEAASDGLPAVVNVLTAP